MAGGANDADGGGAGAEATGTEATGAGTEATGAGAEATGAEATGAGAEATGAGAEATGAEIGADRFGAIDGTAASSREARRGAEPTGDEVPSASARRRSGSARSRVGAAIRLVMRGRALGGGDPDAGAIGSGRVGSQSRRGSPEPSARGFGSWGGWTGRQAAGRLADADLGTNPFGAAGASEEIPVGALAARLPEGCAGGRVAPPNRTASGESTSARPAGAAADPAAGFDADLALEDGDVPGAPALVCARVAWLVAAATGATPGSVRARLREDALVAAAGLGTVTGRVTRAASPIQMGWVWLTEAAATAPDSEASPIGLALRTPACRARTVPRWRIGFVPDLAP